MGTGERRRGAFRAWLGRSIAGDPTAGDRLWRRILHALAGATAAYYLLPDRLAPGLPRTVLPLLAIVVVGGLEALRLSGRLALPTIREYESRRPAGYAYFAAGAAALLLLTPAPVGAPVLAGAALIDPFIGELRHRGTSPVGITAAAALAYGALAAGLLFAFGVRSPLGLAVAAPAATAVALAAEAPNVLWLDDDLLMLLAPAAVLVTLGLALPLGL